MHKPTTVVVVEHECALIKQYDVPKIWRAPASVEYYRRQCRI